MVPTDDPTSGNYTRIRIGFVSNRVSHHTADDRSRVLRHDRKGLWDTEFECECSTEILAVTIALDLV